MEETKKCPYCGEEILAVAKKCKYCGEWLDGSHQEKKQIPCPVCGELVDEGTTVCPHCKEDFSKQEQYVKENPIPNQNKTSELLSKKEEQKAEEVKPDMKEVQLEKKPKKIPKIYLIIDVAIIGCIIAILVLLKMFCSNYFYDNYRIFGLYFYMNEIDVPLIIIGISGVAFLIWYSIRFHIIHIQIPKIRIPTATSRKRRIILRSAITVLVLALCGFGIFKYQTYKKEKQEQAEKQKQEEQDRYVQNAITFKYDASIIYNLSALILSDYHDNWVNAIWDDTAIDTNGHKRRCSKFQTAVDWRIDHFTNNGFLEKLDSLENDMAVAYMAMDSLKQVPEKYASLKTSYDDIRNKVSGLVELCKSPSGNITEFGNNINEMTTDLSTALKETDIYINSQDYDAKEFVHNLFSY
jgi:hypothetical protein